MNRANCLMIMAATLSLIAGCTRHFDARISSAALESVGEADVSSKSFMGIRDSTTQVAGKFIVLRFTTSIDIAKAARDLDVTLVGYSLYPCDQKKAYLHSGNVYPVGEEPNTYTYEARVPPTWSQLIWIEPSGEVTSGWPPEAISAANLCFEVRGANMLGMGISSGQIRVNEVRDLLKRSD